MKHTFIREELSGACTVRTACPLLEVRPSGYYRFLKATPSARRVRRPALADAVVRVHAQSRRDLRDAEDLRGAFEARPVGSPLLLEHIGLAARVCNAQCAADGARVPEPAAQATATTTQ